MNINKILMIQILFFPSIRFIENKKWRWLFHPPTPEKKKRFFRPPRASNGLMMKPFDLGGLQMILSEPPMSNSSGGTHMDHASRPKFSFLKKMCKKLSYFLKQKIAVIQAKSFCVQKNFKKNSNFSLLNSESTKLCFGSK